MSVAISAAGPVGGCGKPDIDEFSAAIAGEASGAIAAAARPRRTERRLDVMVSKKFIAGLAFARRAEQ
ncbi:hypothetical protein BRAS3843_2720012 [Bradyrhizobium sp. STM 3843]|nr:hypothetical protein BRAS3843_2720012 [Bradyrhizobium sp. STM 3843]